MSRTFRNITGENTFANSFAIGIIDKDKVQMGYVSECDQIAKTSHLTLYRHKNTNPQFKSLFVALKDNGEISALRSTLRYLCEHKYEVDEDKLKQSFEHSGSE